MPVRSRGSAGDYQGVPAGSQLRQGHHCEGKVRGVVYHGPLHALRVGGAGHGEEEVGGGEVI